VPCVYYLLGEIELLRKKPGYNEKETWWRESLFWTAPLS
jgi:hypothetical protein